MNPILSAPVMLPASIPSPDQGVWHLGPAPIRAYALCIVAGIIVAIWLGNRRWIARGGSPNAVFDVAIWAVPFGIVGARIYHVITDNQLYFGEGQDPSRIFEIWEGGIGIWGAVAGGALGAWIACRRHGIPFPAMADTLAPGVLLAQGIGRWGNWFNQELFGEPTDLPWGLEIDPGNRPAGYEDVETFHPTFLYESLWAIGVALLLLWADRRFQLGHGRVLALYVAGYTLGRSVFEYLRIDPANEILGLRVNQWVSGALFVLALAAFVVLSRRRPGREAPEVILGGYADTEADARDEPETSAHQTGDADEAGSGDNPQAERAAAGPRGGTAEPDAGATDTGVSVKAGEPAQPRQTGDPADAAEPDPAAGEEPSTPTDSATDR